MHLSTSNVSWSVSRRIMRISMGVMMITLHAMTAVDAIEGQERNTRHMDLDSSSGDVMIVDLRDGFIPYTTKIACQACAGLYNRHQNTTTPLPSVYTLLHSPEDEHWMDDLGIDTSKNSLIPWIHRPYKTAHAFLQECLMHFPRRIRYRYYGLPRRIVPNILTIGSVLSAVPLQDDDFIFDVVSLEDVDTVLDAVSHPILSQNDATTATEWVYNTYGHNTTAMAKINPGYDTTQLPTLMKKFREPPLAHELKLGLIDYLYSHKLFAFYMYYGCTPAGPSPMQRFFHPKARKLVRRMVEERGPNGVWGKAPLPVYGYDDTWNVMGGDAFEAETLCAGEHDMGQVATEDVNNLSFFARFKGKSSELQEEQEDIQAESSNDQEDAVQDSTKTNLKNHLQSTPTTPFTTYNSNKTYVALVIGDGDNVNFIKGTRSDWMRRRVHSCLQRHSSSNNNANDEDLQRRFCFPLTWTMSPHLPYLAPEILGWYRKQSDLITASLNKDGMHNGGSSVDSFILPPSGHLYAYPAMMPPDVQENFVTATEQDALQLNTTGVVDWEFFTSWSHAFKDYYPRFTAKGVVRGIFTVNVPYMMPTGKFLPEEYFKIIQPPTSSSMDGEEAKPVVVFRPREWRGVSSRQCNPASSIPAGAAKDYKSPYGMAKELAGLKRGTVTYIYLTSDGGLDISDVEALAHALPEDVELVSTDVATELALKASGLGLKDGNSVV